MRILLLLWAGLGATACQTTIAFENQVPGVVVHDIRFINADTTHGLDGALLPGERSDKISLYGEDPGQSGRIAFELDLDGRRIFLEVDDRFDPKDDEDNRFVLTPETKVSSPLLAEAPMALWAAPTDGEGE